MLNSRILVLPLTVATAALGGCDSAQLPINDGYGDYLLVPAGEFLMGDNFDEGNSDEIPVHSVLLDAYYVGKHKITNAAYSLFMDAGGYTTVDFWQAGGFGEHGSEPDHWLEGEFQSMVPTHASFK